MKKDEEYKGFWFLPENSNNKIPGILYFKADREVKLELIGGFDSDMSKLLFSTPIEIIHGMTYKNEQVSLLMCRKSVTWNTSSEYPISTYFCKYLILGKHLTNIEEPLFNKLRVNISSLFNWYPSARIKNSILFSADDEVIETNIKICDSDYWENEVKIDNEFSLKFFGAANFSIDSEHKDYNLSQDTYIELGTTNSKRSFLDLLNKVQLFRQFLTLASLSANSYSELILFDDSDFQKTAKGKTIFKKVFLFFIDRKDNIESNNNEFLFTHNEISSIFPDIIVKWYDLKESLSPIRHHLIESVKNKKTFTSLDFLIIIQALEGYHRRFISAKRNSLENRLLELVSNFKQIKKVKLTIEDITKAVKSRHYYSHFYDKETSVLDGVELFKLTQQLRILLVCCVLHLIGFDFLLIDKLVNKSSSL